MLNKRIGLALLFASAVFAGAEVKYQNDFEKAETGSFPDDLMILDGQFTIEEESGNKFLRLPGAPLDTFGVLFGPNEKEDVAVSARFFGTAKGRRYPVFDVGLHGVGGYKLRVVPAKKKLELYRSDSLKTSAPLDWDSGKWTYLKLQTTKTAENEWTIEGKFWQEGEKEPSEPAIVFKDTEAPASGKASVTGMPYSGTPIRFDDLLVTGLAKQ